MLVEIQGFIDEFRIAIPQDTFIDMLKAQMDNKKSYEISEANYQQIKANYGKIDGRVL